MLRFGLINESEDLRQKGWKNQSVWVAVGKGGKEARDPFS